MGVAVFPAASGGVTQYVETFTGTTTWTAPSNCYSVDIFAVGGGGGGGGTTGSTNGNFNYVGGGGGGGGVMQRKLTVVPGTTYTLTIGAGGAGSGNGTSNGSAGGTTSFGALLSVDGGGGGQGCPQTGQVALNSLGANGGGSQASGGSGDRTGGCGGGAGGNPIVVTPLTLAANVAYMTEGNSNTNHQANFGFAGSPGIQGNSLISARLYTGPGIDGYGAGGPGGIALGNDGPYYVGRQGGSVAPVRTTSSGNNLSGNSGPANTGAGGGGAATRSDGNTASASGGTGGSGYIKITYWK